MSTETVQRVAGAVVGTVAVLAAYALAAKLGVKAGKALSR